MLTDQRCSQGISDFLQIENREEIEIGQSVTAYATVDRSARVADTTIRYGVQTEIR